MSERDISCIAGDISGFPQILLIAHIAEMQGEFANTLVIEAGADGASRVREA